MVAFQEDLIYKLQDSRTAGLDDAQPFPHIPGPCQKQRGYLVGSGSFFLLLPFEPALLNRSGLASGSLALNFDLLALVGGELTGKVGLLGRRGGLWESELLDVGFGVTGLDGGGLIGLEFTEVQVLDGVGWRGMAVSTWMIGANVSSRGRLQKLNGRYIPRRTAEVKKVRRATGTCCREARVTRER